MLCVQISWCHEKNLTVVSQTLFKKKIYNLHSTFKSSTSLKQFSQNAGKWDYLIVFINLEKSHLYRIQLSKRGLVPVCILKADEAKSLNQELFLFSLCITLHCCLVILCPFRPSCLSCRDSTQFHSFHTIPTFSKSMKSWIQFTECFSILDL